jgi:hypothetical protein
VLRLISVGGKLLMLVVPRPRGSLSFIRVNLRTWLAPHDQDQDYCDENQRVHAANVDAQPRAAELVPIEAGRDRRVG